MKFLQLITIIFALACFSACEQEQLFVTEKTTNNNIDFRSSSSVGGSSTGQAGVVYSATELIVQYDDTWTETEKQDLRDEFQVSSYEVCAHCDDHIEKWDFDPGVDIEHKYSTAEGKEAEAEGFKVDREFGFPGSSDTFSLSGGSENTAYSSYIVSENTGVSIAVLDTGVDANYPSFSEPFLYKADGEIAEIQSGWDYVQEDDNCYDDNEKVHGTAVASIINKHLRSNDIPHQILPVKIADETGKISLFNALCALSYAASRVDIVQMSFGWYDTGEDEDAFTNDIFSGLIEQYEDEVLFVSSAGNSAYDNDIHNHYPSNYTANNVLAIAAANSTLDDIAAYSNYGATSVDFMSLGTEVPFMNAGGDPVSISGTSFAAPQVAAIAAEKMYEAGMSLTPLEVLALLDESGVFIESSKPILYNKLLLP